MMGPSSIRGNPRICVNAMLILVRRVALEFTLCLEHRRCGNAKAQGNALGEMPSASRAPKGRPDNREAESAPLGLRGGTISITQGVALGFFMVAPLELKTSSTLIRGRVLIQCDSFAPCLVRTRS